MKTTKKKTVFKTKVKDKKNTTAVVTQDTAENPSKKKKKKLHILWLIIPIILLVIIGLLLSQMGSMFKGMTMESTVKEEVLNISVENGSIETILAAAGSIAEPESSEIKLAQKVSISSLEVNNGDVVEEGDVIAYVDKSTVLLAITEIQDMLNSLDEELEEAKEDAIEDTILATSAGRVKAVFAQEGAGVVDTMVDNEALILVSLDGRMAVEIETATVLSVGDIVTITDSEGTEYSGKVSEKRPSTFVCTVSDEEIAYGDTVTVTDGDGNKLGSGTLYINSEQKITGFTGTVKTIKVAVNDKVSTGDTLITLEDTNYAALYDALLNQRHTLEAQMQELFGLYQSGVILATEDGLVSGLDENGLAAQTSTGITIKTAVMNGVNALGTYASGLLNKGLTILGLAENAPAAAEGEVADFGAKVTSVADISDNKLGVVISEQSITLGDYKDLSGVDVSGLTYQATLDVPSGVAVYIYDATGSSWSTQSLVDLKVGQKIICTYDSNGNLLWIVAEKVADETENEDSNVPSGEDSSIPSGENSSIPNGENSNIPGGENSNVPSGENSNIPSGGFPENSENSETASGDFSGPMNGDVSGSMEDNNGTNGSFSNGSMNIGDLSGISAGSFSSGSFSGGTYSTDMGTMGMTGTTEETTAAEAAAQVVSKYSITESSLCTITPQDQVTIDVTIDELDILSIHIGDEAKITLDALSGQSFTGTVTSINAEGTNSGGNTKFTVTVTMDRTANMYSGMNAAVNFVQKVTSDVVTIPVAALSESGNTVYVYTSYNADEDVLGDPVEVRTGVSDGENVEIVEGLAEGETIYYRYAESIVWSFQK